MISKIYTAAVVGLEAQLVEVETDLSSGLPSTVVVGLPDAAIRESRERVKSALKHASVKYPQSRVAINLAPADLPKIGTHYDLPIAVSLLLNKKVMQFDSEGRMFAGELSLDGKLRPVSGMLVIAELAKRKGFHTIYVPEENAREVSLVKDLKIVPVKDLPSLIKMLNGLSKEKHFSGSAWDEVETGIQDSPSDFKHIRGQEMAKRALEIAAAGGHNVLMSGPPGSGKTMLAKGLATILPSLQEKEALETTKIYSVSGMLDDFSQGLVTSRPFRSPHHTSSNVALVGGGSDPRPGEVTLAHRGVLFLDEFPEFPRSVLESLRQPLEDGVIHVSRATRSVTFPAEFMLVAAQNPCPCGYYGDTDKSCTCSPAQLIRYQKKVSGPILDRIDLHAEVPRLSFEKIEKQEDAESSSAVQARVEKARRVQRARFKKVKRDIQTNSQIGMKELKAFCRPDEQGLEILRNAVATQHLSARAYHRVLKIARTISDLKEKEQITADEIAEALMFRPKEEK